MTKRILGVATLVAATVIGAGSAFAAYQTSSAPVITQTISQTAGPNTANTISGGSTRGIGGGQGMFGINTAAYTQGSKGFADAGAPGTGASAGNGAQRFGIWGNFAGTGFNEDQSAIESSGQIYTFAVGGDYRFNDWVIGGLSLGYERQNIDTTFNQGTWDSNGVVVAPYAVVQLIPNQLFLDATVGYVGQSIDLERSSGAINADTDGTRFFMSSNLQGNLQYGKWRVRPVVGAMWMYQGIDGYTESGAGGQTVDDTTVHFGRLRAGSQLGYSFGNIQPFVLAEYQYDFKSDMPVVAAGQPQPQVYRNSALLGGGVLFAISQRLTGGVQFQSEVGKTDYISYTGQGTIRYAF